MQTVAGLKVWYYRVHVRACVRVCVCACVHACVHVCVYMHACVYIGQVWPDAAETESLG